MKKIYYTILIFIFFQSCAPIKTAEGLSKTVGNIANYGACEDKQTLINSTQQASDNTEEVIIMISTILCLIIIFSI